MVYADIKLKCSIKGVNLMKVCPGCGTVYDNGEICGNCGNYLVSMSQDLPQSYGGYDSAPIQGAGYSGSSYSQDLYSQSSYPSYSSSAYDPSSYPTQDFPQSQPSYSSSYSAPSPSPSYPSQPAYPVVPVVKKRTGLVVFLLLLVLLLSAAIVYLAVFRGALDWLINPQEGPTQMEQAVATSAWDWYSQINAQVSASDIMNQMDTSKTNIREDVYNAIQNTQNGTANNSAEEASNADASSNAASSASQNTQVQAPQGAQTQTAAFMSSDMPSDNAASPYSVLVTNNTGSSASAGGASSASEGDSAIAGQMQGLDSALSSMGSLYEGLYTLNMLLQTDYAENINAPMEALPDEYSDLKAGWKDLYTTMMQWANDSGLNAPLSSSGNASGADSSQSGVGNMNQGMFVETYMRVQQSAQNFKRLASTAGFDTANWS